MTRWRYEIQHGPDGDANYAWVFDGKNSMVCTAKLHHAFMIVGSVNSDEMAIIETPPIPPLLQREWMARALFEVDAPDHLEWDDCGFDKRERYLCLADAALRRTSWSTTSNKGAGKGAPPVAWRWRTLPQWREADDDEEWQFLTVEPKASDFMNFHHHEFEPLYLDPLAGGATTLTTPAVTSKEQT